MLVPMFGSYVESRSRVLDFRATVFYSDAAVEVLRTMARGGMLDRRDEEVVKKEARHRA